MKALKKLSDTSNQTDTEVLLKRLCLYLMELNLGECSITEKTIEREESVDVQELLSAILLLYENMNYRDEQMKSKTGINLELEKKNTIMALAIAANHYINQPLTAIKGSVYMLRNLSKRYKAEPEFEVHFNLIDLALREMDLMLEHLSVVSDTKTTNYHKSFNMIDFEKAFKLKDE